MDLKKIGSFISSCRKKKGFTQAQLAERLNITNRAISKWETGKSLPDPSIMLELCSLLNIDVNELLTGETMSPEKYKESAENNLICFLRSRKHLFVIRLTGELLTVCGIIIFLGFPDILALNMTQELVMRVMGIFIFGCGTITTYFSKKYLKG